MIAVTPTIETERLRLRGWRNGDLAPLAAFYAFDPGSAWVGGPLDETEAWRRLMSFAGHWSLNGYGLFAIESKDSRAWIGWCGLWKPVDFPETELGWTLVEAARGKGYVAEAAPGARAAPTGAPRLFRRSSATSSPATSPRNASPNASAARTRAISRSVASRPRSGGIRHPHRDALR